MKKDPTAPAGEAERLPYAITFSRANKETPQQASNKQAVDGKKDQDGSSKKDENFLGSKTLYKAKSEIFKK